MKLVDYLQELLPEERECIKIVVEWLRSLSTEWAEFCKNLDTEAQPDSDCWALLVDFLKACSGDDVNYQLTLHIRKHCSKYQLRGSRATDSERQNLTRLVTLGSFIDLIVEQELDGMQPWQVEPFVKEHVIGQETAKLPSWILDVRLGLYIMWGAIELEVPRNLASALLAMCRCGIAPPTPEESIVCLKYRLPDGLVSCTPTIFDAYGGWPWPEYFKTGVWDGDRCEGYTQPRPDCAHENGFREVVSEPVTFSQLCAPVWIAEVLKWEFKHER
jgi:hypothetical protein